MGYMPFRLQHVSQPAYQLPVHIIRVACEISAVGYIAAKRGILSTCAPWL